MAHQWDPEVSVTADLATALIESQFPALAPATVEPLGEGWDNTAFLVNADLVFRFPRREIAVPLLLMEGRLLPHLAARLPLPIPDPQWQGVPSSAYGWPFAGYRSIPGRSGCRGADGPVRTAVATPLASFLKALHAVDADAAARWGAGPDPVNRINAVRYRASAHTRLDHLFTRGVIHDLPRFLAVLDEACAASLDEPHTLVHGDLYSCHLVINDRGGLGGVIDWGDVHWGHRAVDLGVAWAFLPPAARDAFFDDYGPISEDCRRLARGHALLSSLLLEEYGRDRGDEALVAEAVTALGNLIAE